MKRGFVIVCLVLTGIAAPLLAQGDYGAPGTLKWRYETGSAVHSPAIGSDGTIYIRSSEVVDEERIFYFDAITSKGELKWRYKIGRNPVWSSPSIGADGTIYFGSRDYGLYALTSSGELKWRYETGDVIWSSPATSNDGTIYVGSWDNYLYALTPKGSLKWRYKTGGAVSSSPSIGADGTVYVGSSDNYLYALSPLGTLKWRYKTGAVIGYSSPAIGLKGSVYVGSSDNCLYAINPDGSLRWRYETGGKVESSPAINLDGTIYVGSLDNYLYALNPYGNLKWKFKTEAAIVAEPTVGSDGTIYVGSQDSCFYAVSSSGRLQWSYKTSSRIKWGSAISIDGTIYVGSDDGYLYAIRSDSRGLANSAWPKFGHDNQNTGRAGSLEAIASEPVNPPALSFSATSSTGTNTLVGGTVGGVVAVVHNRGKGNAQRVKVSLTGDDELCKLLGWSKDVALIESGDSAIVEFTKYLPTDLQRRTVNLKVSVTEGRGYSPTDIVSLSLKLVPAKQDTIIPELVEDVDHDIPTSGIRRDGYALIVGISNYLYTSGPAYAQHDAEVFSLYAEKVLGIPSNNIKLLTDNKATGGIITGQLKDWLAEKSGFKVIYFAGHGVPDPKNPHSGQPYLLPHDGDPELQSTLINVDDLAALAGDTTDTILLILDACFSGGGKGRTPELAQRPVVLAEIPEEHGIYLAAAEGKQAAKDYLKAKHGYFTYYLLLGLRGRADANSDGWITTGELHRFVRERVLDATNNLQEPVLRPQVEVEIGKWK